MSNQDHRQEDISARAAAQGAAGAESADGSRSADSSDSQGTNVGKDPNTGLTGEDALNERSADATGEPSAADQQESPSGTDATGPAGDERVAALEAELADLKDQYLRKSADFENFRKRMHREKEESIAFGNRQLLLDIVPIIDDFERAIRSAEESKDFDAFHDGIVLIEKQFTGMLERKWGLQRFESVGEEFDPQKHEAVTTEPVPEHEESRVLEDYQKGYLLHDKVLRTAKVKVSLPGPNT